MSRGDKSTAAEPEFGFIHAPILSFYARALYRDAAARWQGSGLPYVLFLSAVLAVPDAARMHVKLRHALDASVVRAAENMTPLVVKDGVLTVDHSQPYDLFTDPDTGQVAILVDTTGSLTGLDGSSASALLMKDRFLFKQADGTVTTQLYSELGDFTADGPTVLALMTSVRRFMVVLFYPFATLYLFCWTTLVVLLLSMAARMMVARAGSRLPAPVLHRVTALAMTPALVATKVLPLEGVTGLWLVSALMTMGYLTFALSSVLDPHAGEDNDSDDD